MRLDRNIGGAGRGKYGLIKNRRLAEIIEAKADSDWAISHEVQLAVQTLEAAGVLDWGTKGTESEFFVIKLRDENAQGVLARYAGNAMTAGDGELAADVFDIAARSGLYSPFCKKPD